MEKIIVDALEESAKVKQKVARDLVNKIQEASILLIDVFKAGGKVVLFGNGGSAADAQHIAAELLGRFQIERPSLPALALTTNTSVLTALGNDYNNDAIFAKQVEAMVQPGDVVIAISTSGNSSNVLQALKLAKEKGAKTVGLSGKGGGQLAKLVDHALIIPSRETPRIQEAHITIGHIICDLVERKLFGSNCSLMKKGS